jgi:selenocysteine lyase/cysteine desulfurase
LAISSPAYDLDALRQLYPHTQHTTFLNHAAVSPLAIPIKQALHAAVDLTSGDNLEFWSQDWDAVNRGLRANIGRLIGADAEEIALIPNVSTALNMVALMLPSRPGQNIIICDKEFPANVYPWKNLARRAGLELRIVPPEFGGLTVNRLAEHADENTLLVSVSTVQFLSGYRANMHALGAFCRERGIYFAADGIQSLGHVPLSVREANVDFLAAGSFKSLLGPLGMGFLYMRRELCDQLDMAMVGAGSVTYGDWFCHYGMDFKPGASRLELGSGNWMGMLGFNAALDLLHDLGVANIDAWTTHLSDVLIDDVERRGYRALTPRDPACHGPIVSFAVPDVQAAHQRLTDARVMTSIREGYLRVSCHAYNTVADMLQVGEVLGRNGR